MDDDAPRPVPRFTPLPLDRLGEEELRRYIDALRAEIDRVEADIGRKRAHRDAAHDVFKPRTT